MICFYFVLRVVLFFVSYLSKHLFLPYVSVDEYEKCLLSRSREFNLILYSTFEF